MRFPKGYAGVNKLFASEIINIFSSVMFFVASVFAVFSSQRIVNPQYLPIIVIPLIASGLMSVVAFILQLVGLGQAKKDDQMFKTAFAFVFVGVAASVVSFMSGGTLSNIFSNISEVSSLIVSVYTILGIYNFAEKMDNASIMLNAKIAIIIGASAFAVAVILRMVPVFFPRTEYMLDLFVSVTELTAYIIFLICLGRARGMLAEKK